LSSTPVDPYVDPDLETTAGLDLPFDNVETLDMENTLSPYKTPKKQEKESRKNAREASVESKTKKYKKPSGKYITIEDLETTINFTSDLTGDEKQYILYDSKNKTNKKPVITERLENVFKRKFKEDNVDATPESAVPTYESTYEDMPPLIPYSDEKETTEGSGIKRLKFKIPKRKRRIVGGGLKPPQMVIDEAKYPLPNEKLTIDLARLKRDNVIAIKYKTNKNCPPSLKVQHVSQSCSDIILDIVKNKYDKRFFKLLSPIEKKLVEDFVLLAKYNIEVDSELSKDFRENYDILYGEFMSGNDNKEIKSKLKQYILYGMKTGKLRKSEGMQILVQMS
jgi:hypothetical protein